ncbi:MAG: hypothetical protein Q8R91_06050 [Candidatus Omnitrophota bacterium]|nr:hypothetical protein [Candidatus Omnitrophota bacterium]
MAYGWLPPNVLFLLTFIAFFVVFPRFFSQLFSGKQGWVFAIVIFYFLFFPPEPLQKVSELWNGTQTSHSPKDGCAVIEFKNEPPFVKREVLTISSEVAYFFNLQVSNKSCDATLHVIEWKIINLQRREDRRFAPWGEIYSASLEWDARPYIARKDHVWIAFAHIFSAALQAKKETHLSAWNSGLPNFRFNIASWHPAMTSHLEPGIYRFTLMVSFDNAPPAESVFELNWPGDHHDNMEQMAHKIKIRKL